MPPFGAYGETLLEERRSGDVEVDPRRRADELLQEERRGDAAGVAAADVLEIGDRALDVVLVLGDERQLPERLAGLAR